MTRTSTTMGSPLYMSPEQMESARQVDARSDIWALGVTLFELLTGKLPFSGETLPEVCLKITTQRAPPVRSLRADVPEPIEAAILKCLEKDRTKRYANVGELCAAIAAFAPGRASLPSAPQVQSTLSAPGGSETLMASDFLTESARSRRRSLAESVLGVGLTTPGFPRRRAGVAVVGAMALVVGAGGIFLVRSQGPAPALSTGSPVVPSIVSAPAPRAEPAAVPSESASARALLEPLASPQPSDVPSAEPSPVLRQGIKRSRPDTAGSPASGPRSAPQPRLPTPQAPAAPAPDVPDPPRGQSAYDERL